jgi:DNA ligase-1
MKAFAALYNALDETNKTSEKVAALVRYFRAAPAADAAWAVYFLIGRRPRQVVPSRKLWAWAVEAAGMPDWLFQESYLAVGDIAETVALALPEPERSSDLSLAWWIEQRLLALRNASEADQNVMVLGAWADLDRGQRFVWNKLITGAFRVGVSTQLVTRALAEAAGLDVAVVAHRLMGDWQPTSTFYEQLRTVEAGDADSSRPYPFFLAHPLDGSPETLGAIQDWQTEWKWDGIRAQLIRRSGRTFLWSRGEELVTDRYPELAEASACLPEGTVIDGEILPWLNGAVQPFGSLQRRIGRKTLSKKILQDVPVILMAFDLLEDARSDVRPLALQERRRRLEEILAALHA